MKQIFLLFTIFITLAANPATRSSRKRPLQIKEDYARARKPSSRSTIKGGHAQQESLRDVAELTLYFAAEARNAQLAIESTKNSNLPKSKPPKWSFCPPSCCASID